MTEESSTMQDETTKPRDLDTLLRLGTYQGMSDAEVQSVIEFHRRNAYSQGSVDAMNDASASQARDAREAAALAWQNAQASLTNACAISPDFKGIELDLE